MGWLSSNYGFLINSSGVHARTHAVGHMSVDIEPDSEWRKVIAAVRAVHPKVPIVVFGGHHHVRFLFQPPSLSLLFFLPPSFTPKSGCAAFPFPFRLWAMETETDGTDFFYFFFSLPRSCYRSVNARDTMITVWASRAVGTWKRSAS